MLTFGNKKAYEKYSKSEKRAYWLLLMVTVCGASLVLAWKPYIRPFLKMLSQ